MPYYGWGTVHERQTDASLFGRKWRHPVFWNGETWHCMRPGCGLTFGQDDKAAGEHSWGEETEDVMRRCEMNLRKGQQA